MCRRSCNGTTRLKIKKSNVITKKNVTTLH